MIPMRLLPLLMNTWGNQLLCYLSLIAEERGRYASYEGSLWDKGILPVDSIKL